jgi:ABC-type dipeptide/oligopeptide/nickel transport system ATPase subunit
MQVRDPRSGEHVHDADMVDVNGPVGKAVSMTTSSPEFITRKLDSCFRRSTCGARDLVNVELPVIDAGVPANERVERAKGALAALGWNHAFSTTNELSGGQRQRVAIARARC